MAVLLGRRAEQGGRSLPGVKHIHTHLVIGKKYPGMLMVVMIIKIDANANLSKSKPKADREKWTKTLEIASVYLLSETSFTFSLFFLGHCQSSVTSKGHKLTGRRLWCTTRRQEEHTHKHTCMSYIDIKTFRNTPNISDFKVGVNRLKAGIFLVFVVFDCNLKMASVSFQMRSHLLH